MLARQQIITAMTLDGFDDWFPDDLVELHRPRFRPDDLDGDGRTAAVLLLIYPDTQQVLRTVLTRRQARLNHHGGQISLPGGSQDPGESLRRTAEREANEELGIDPTQLEILGTLNTIYIPPSDFTVFPYVGWLDRRPQFRPADSEVAEVIEVPLGRLLDPETRVTGKIQVASGDHLDLPYYAIDHHQVWGATALILSEFIERLRRVI